MIFRFYMDGLLMRWYKLLKIIDKCLIMLKMIIWFGVKLFYVMIYINFDWNGWRVKIGWRLLGYFCGKISFIYVLLCWYC